MILSEKHTQRISRTGTDFNDILNKNVGKLLHVFCLLFSGKVRSFAS